VLVSHALVLQHLTTALQQLHELQNSLAYQVSWYVLHRQFHIQDTTLEDITVTDCTCVSFSVDNVEVCEQREKRRQKEQDDRIVAMFQAAKRERLRLSAASQQGSRGQ